MQELRRKKHPQEATDSTPTPTTRSNAPRTSFKTFQPTRTSVSRIISPNPIPSDRICQNSKAFKNVIASSTNRRGDTIQGWERGDTSKFKSHENGSNRMKSEARPNQQAPRWPMVPEIVPSRVLSICVPDGVAKQITRNTPAPGAWLTFASGSSRVSKFSHKAEMMLSYRLGYFRKMSCRPPQHQTSKTDQHSRACRVNHNPRATWHVLESGPATNYDATSSKPTSARQPLFPHLGASPKKHLAEGRRTCDCEWQPMPK